MDTIEHWLLTFTAASVLIAPVWAQTVGAPGDAHRWWRQRQRKVHHRSVRRRVRGRGNPRRPRLPANAVRTAGAMAAVRVFRADAGESGLSFGLAALMAAEDKSWSRIQAAAVARRS